MNIKACEHDSEVLDLVDAIEEYIDNVRAERKLQQDLSKVENDE